MSYNNKTHGASTINDPNYPNTNSSLSDSNVSHTFDADKGRTTSHNRNHPSSRTMDVETSGQGHGSHHTHHDTTGTTGTTGTGTTSTTGTGTQQYGSTGMAQQPYDNTTGTAFGVKTMNTVESVAKDTQAQIDAQAEEAIRKSHELSEQDYVRLQASIREATSSLEEQARQLKEQIDQEKAIAEQHVRETQQQKLSDVAKTQQLEQQKILEVAAKRKIELEQRSLRLQQEIEEIIRQKTEEMKREKPGNLCFTHKHQDTDVGARLAGDIGHVLDLKNSGRITETTMQGDVQYHPVQVQTQPVVTDTQQPIQTSEQTIHGPETHEKKGGFFHALKTAFTGNHQTTNNTEGTTGTTTTTGVKQQPMAENRAYDQQSAWASDADKHMPQQAR